MFSRWCVTGRVRSTYVPKTGWAITHQLVPVVAFGSSGTGCLSLVRGLPGLVLSLAGEAEAEDLQP
jgi:hypothetical protein